MSEAPAADIPPSGSNWPKNISPTKKKQIEAMGGLDKLLETLRQRMKEQQGRHQGGNKWIGTAGTSPFGAYGYNPEGVRIGQDENRNFRAVKVWDKREFKDLDDQVELGTRNIKVALRRLRRFARTGAPEELDLDGTIKGTAHKGYLDILMRPERHNAVKVLLFFDVGGSMDCTSRPPRSCSRPRAPSSSKTASTSISTIACTRRCGRKNPPPLRPHHADLGRAAHISARNHEQGDLRGRRLYVALRDHGARRIGRAFQRGDRATWMERLARTYPACVWLNPVAEKEWDYTNRSASCASFWAGGCIRSPSNGCKAMRELVR